MKKHFNLINYGLLGGLVFFLIVMIFNGVNYSYTELLLYFLMLATMMFVGGMIINEKSNYRKNVNTYIFLYFVLFILVTMFINRPNVSLFNIDYLTHYLEDVNLMPMKTIVNLFMVNPQINDILINIGGNLLALMPLTFLLVVKDIRFKSYKRQFVILFLTVFMIEIMQFLLGTGQFDVDDFILNIGGALVFLWVLNKWKIVEYTRKAFFTNFKLRKIINYILYIIIVVVTVLVII